MRLDEALRLIGLLLGGEASARATLKLAITTSPDTLLRPDGLMDEEKPV